jgi:two-component system nitrogen regulation sensor histidine kinase NtrY
MKALRIKKHIFLVLSIFLFSLTLFIGYFFVNKNSESSKKPYLQNISRIINNQLDVVIKETHYNTSQIKENKVVRFSNFLHEQNNPCFIFKNKELYFWSDNTFVPSYDVLSGPYKYKTLALRNGKYLAYKDKTVKEGIVWEIITLLPLSKEYSIENNYIKSSLNPEIFNKLPYKINTLFSKQGNNVYTTSGDFLFSVDIPKNHNYKNDTIMFFMVVLSGLAILFLFLYLLKIVAWIRLKNKTDLSIVILFFGLLALRGIMLALNYPFSFYNFDLFNSKFFASSSISPSLGDVLLNTIFIVVFSWYLLNNYYHTITFKLLIRVNSLWKYIISVCLIILSFYSLYLVFNTLGILSYHSQWSLDVTVDINFNIFRIISLVVFIATCIVYFIFTHIFFRLFLSLNKINKKDTVVKFVLGAALFSVISYLFLELYLVLIIIQSIYFLFLFYLKLPKAVSKLKYSTYIYYLSCGLICASTGAYSIYNQNVKKTIFDKQHFATDLLFKNDVFGEYLLNEASTKIKNDNFIKHRLLAPFSSKAIIEYKIKRVFLTNYFDKYDIVVSVFDAFGTVYEKNSDYSSYFEAERKYRKNILKTDYSNIYFFTDPETGSVKYICYNKIEAEGQIVGYVIVELKHKKIIPHSVYPELLVDVKRDRDVQKQDYNYAVFSNEKLLYSFGNYNYDQQFPVSSLTNEDIYSDGIIKNGFHHIAIKGGNGKQIVVSSEKYHFKRIFSNFSFLFLILIVFTLVFIVFYAFRFNFKKIETTYSAKIQIYLNIAFFLPLLIVSVTTLSIISVSYKDNLNKSFLKKAEDISSNISGYLQNPDINDSQKERLENTLLQISKYTLTDINLFTNKGKLLVTNQSMIFDLGILSRVINPYVYMSMVENSSNTIMIPETIGSLKYNSVYVAIRSVENGELLGILSMPFFESKNELDKQIIEVLVTIVNIFVSIFILFVLLSYFASNVLTVPLKIITQKLTRTTLEKNEPIDWATKDEIGLLVGEYNKMLIKLEESKDALTKSEKESAWREMAKQVAHEIKNPLTPMKLTIQHLQRAIGEDDNRTKELTNKALLVLLDQVNNLNEIATSFSLFAKMPIPKNQRFEISSVLSKVAQLHNNNKDVIVETHIEKGDYFVIGDEQLMNGIFTNLILNGIQSVPGNKIAQIQVSLVKKDSIVLITVTDNGVGIPDSIKDKVFLPNFSTKYSGSGIGLAVAKRGVEHAKGKIWFETQENIGTCFFIEIPLADEIS